VSAAEPLRPVQVTDRVTDLVEVDAELLPISPAKNTYLERMRILALKGNEKVFLADELCFILAVSAEDRTPQGVKFNAPKASPGMTGVTFE